MFSVTQMLRLDEGSKNKSYIDSMGNITIGIGFNMDTPNAINIWKQENIPEDFTKVHAGQQTISDLTILKLCNACAENAVKDLKTIIATFDNLPIYVRLALINMMFQLGKMRFGLFKKTMDFIRNGEYEKAANEALNSLWAKQVPERAKRVTDLMKGNYDGYSKLDSSQ